MFQQQPRTSLYKPDFQQITSGSVNRPVILPGPPQFQQRQLLNEQIVYSNQIEEPRQPQNQQYPQQYNPLDSSMQRYQEYYTQQAQQQQLQNRTSLYSQSRLQVPQLAPPQDVPAYLQYKEPALGQSMSRGGMMPQISNYQSNLAAQPYQISQPVMASQNRYAPNKSADLDNSFLQQKEAVIYEFLVFGQEKTASKEEMVEFVNQQCHVGAQYVRTVESGYILSVGSKEQLLAIYNRSEPMVLRNRYVGVMKEPIELESPKMQYVCQNVKEVPFVTYSAVILAFFLVSSLLFGFNQGSFAFLGSSCLVAFLILLVIVIACLINA